MENKPGEPYSPEDSLLGIFQVDLDNYLTVKLAFMYHLHVGVDESWPYWEYEKHLEGLADILQKRKAAEEKSQRETQSSTSMTNPSQAASQMMRQAQSSVPKMPNPGNMKMPKF